MIAGDLWYFPLRACDGCSGWINRVRRTVDGANLCTECEEKVRREVRRGTSEVAYKTAV